MKWNHDEYHQDDYDYNYDARDNNYDLLIDISRKEKPEFVDAPNENHPPSNIDFKSFLMKNKLTSLEDAQGGNSAHRVTQQPADSS